MHKKESQKSLNLKFSPRSKAGSRYGGSRFGDSISNAGSKKQTIFNAKLDAANNKPIPAKSRQDPDPVQESHANLFNIEEPSADPQVKMSASKSGIHGESTDMGATRDNINRLVTTQDPDNTRDDARFSDLNRTDLHAKPAHLALPSNQTRDMSLLQAYSSLKSKQSVPTDGNGNALPK